MQQKQQWKQYASLFRRLAEQGQVIELAIIESDEPLPPRRLYRPTIGLQEWLIANGHERQYRLYAFSLEQCSAWTALADEAVRLLTGRPRADWLDWADALFDHAKPEKRTWRGFRNGPASDADRSWFAGIRHAGIKSAELCEKLAGPQRTGRKAAKSKQPTDERSAEQESDIYSAWKQALARLKKQGKQHTYAKWVAKHGADFEPEVSEAQLATIVEKWRKR